MPLDPRAKRLLDMLALGQSGTAGPVGATERRQAFRSLMRLSRPPLASGSSQDRTIAGPSGPLPVRCYTPADAPGPILPGLVFFHGGGLVAGDLDTHDGLCRALCEAARCRVVSVGYRLAPEHPFPAAVEDAVEATCAVAAQAAGFGIDPGRIGVAGDSAGGTVATLAALAARDRGGPPLRLQLLLCPVLDLAERRPSRLAYGQGYMLDQATMDRDLADYLPAGIDPADPRVSPIRTTDLAGLPETLIHTAEFDPLRDEGRDYADRLVAAGVPVRHTCHPGMIHHFVGLAGMIPAAAAALTVIGAELRQAFGR